MSAQLPDAEWTNPNCGVCHGETSCEEAGFYDCQDCRLTYVDNGHGDLKAQFTDEDEKPCEQACTNTWHGDHKVRHGQGYRCGTCLLPASHEGADRPESFRHHTACKPITLDAAA